MYRFATLALCLLIGCLIAVAPPVKPAVTLYDSEPDHLWNQLHAALLTRPDRAGTIIGHDSLDPPLFPTTKRLLQGPTHDEAVKLLDLFLANGHKLVRDPVKRAILQRDLWAVFTWAAYPSGNYYHGEGVPKIRTGPLQQRLARAIRLVALSKAEAEALPDTYALAAKAMTLPPAFDPAKPNASFLPPDLFDPTGPWVCVTGPREMPTPIASSHARISSGRSVFLVLIKLPEGRKATLAYLDTLNTFPRPWKVSPQKEEREDGRRVPAEVNPDVPQFPVGTQLALVRQMVVVTADDKPMATSLTESVQMRTYHKILPRERDTEGRKAQGFVELKLRRADLFAGKAGGFQAIDVTEPVDPALTFFREWADPIESRTADKRHRRESTANLCASCHSRGGIRSVNSYAQFGAASPTATLGLIPTNVTDERKRTTKWVIGLKDWAELRKLAE